MPCGHQCVPECVVVKVGLRLFLGIASCVFFGLRAHVLRRVHKSPLPKPLQKWLKQAITILPTKTPPVHKRIVGARTTAIHHTVCDMLRHASNTDGPRPIRHIKGNQSNLKTCVRRACAGAKCNCAAIAQHTRPYSQAHSNMSSCANTHNGKCFSTCTTHACPS